jgi:hypothetical protein
MTEAEMEQKVREKATSALGSPPLRMEVRTRLKSFLDGTLYFVYYQPSQDIKELLLYAYFKGDDVIIINNIEELAKVMSVYRPASKLGDVFSLGAVAGIIALLVTITLCCLILLKGVTDPPQILSAALTSILGLYFGSKVVGKG